MNQIIFSVHQKEKSNKDMCVFAFLLLRETLLRSDNDVAAFQVLLSLR